MKPSKLKLKWKLFFLLTILLAIVLVVLWTFQLVLMDDFYRAMQNTKLKESAGTITANIDNERLDKLLETVSYREDISIVIMDAGGNIRFSEYAKFSVIEHLTAASLYTRFEEAVNGNGEYREYYPHDDYYESPDYPFDDDIPGLTSESAESLIYTKVIYNGAGERLALIMDATITPVNTLFRAVIALLTTATVCIVIIALIVTVLMARTVAKPIEAITESAMEMATGNEVVFRGGGYMEIDKLSEALNYAAGEIATIENLRRELISNVSHDLRTPLTLIKGYSELMKDIPGENSAENIQIIIDETERLTNLVNDMLDLSRIQEGGRNLNLTVFDIIPVLYGIIERHAKLLERDGYTIEFQHGESAPVLADQVKITQVIYNLLSNAINYAGDDKKVIIKEFTHGENVRIEIIDNGIGIDVDILPHIWDRYYKSDRSHRRATVGTGLGLSIVKNIMSVHPGGVYGVQSSVGEGSCFYIELPLNTAF